MDNWTDELLNLMVEKLIERKHRETNVIEKAGKPYVPVESLAARSGGMIKMVKRHGN